MVLEYNMELTNINHGDVLCAGNKNPTQDERHFGDNESHSASNVVHEVTAEEAADWRTGGA